MAQPPLVGEECPDYGRRVQRFMVWYAQQYERELGVRYTRIITDERAATRLLRLLPGLDLANRARRMLRATGWFARTDRSITFLERQINSPELRGDGGPVSLPKGFQGIRDYMEEK